MIPLNLKLANFTSYGEKLQELDFTKFKLAAISGLNGAGKSSLLDSITWCVWGTSRAGDSSDDLIHTGSSEMFVEFSFEMDGNKFTVKRARSKKSGGSTSLELWSGKAGHNLTEGTIKATQDKIINLLHLTYETFTNSAYLRQGHADEFTTKGATDRKRILSDILGLSHYDILEEKAKEKTKDIQTKLQLLEYQFLEIEAEISQKDERQKELDGAKQKVLVFEQNIKSLEEEIKDLQKEKESLSIISQQRRKIEENLASGKKELEQIIFQGKQRAQRIKQLEDSVKNLAEIEKSLNNKKILKEELEKLNQQNRNILELEKNHAQIKSSLDLKIQKKKLIEKAKDELNNKIKNLSIKAAVCPTCGQPIGADQKHKVIVELRNDLKKIEKEISVIKTNVEVAEIVKLENEIKSLSFENQRLQDIQKELQNLELLQKEKEEGLQNRATLETEKKTVDELRLLFKDKDLKIKQMEEEFNKMPGISSDLNQIILKLSQKETQLQSLRDLEKEARGFLGRATELITRAEHLEKVYRQKGEEKSILQKEKEIFEELSLAFGKKGIQAMIIESAIPEIEDETNNLLEKLTDGRMKVSLITQKTTKTKVAGGERGIVETLDIIIADEMGERPYEMYSGGEAFRVNFAIRLAISKLLTHRAGARLQFLVIDEGFGSQDAPGQARLVEIIDAIKNDFEKILIITHIEELKEEFPVRIDVTKGPQGSTFEIIGV
ncbi:SMC family ATPase [Candidatus Daviesbacteria bacterium]|nr:SMC family ATPase [Candidatus Daviesbacteria bacterium]